MIQICGLWNQIMQNVIIIFNLKINLVLTQQKFQTLRLVLSLVNKIFYNRLIFISRLTQVATLLSNILENICIVRVWIKTIEKSSLSILISSIDFIATVKDHLNKIFMSFRGGKHEDWNSIFIYLALMSSSFEFVQETFNAVNLVPAFAVLHPFYTHRSEVS